MSSSEKQALPIQGKRARSALPVRGFEIGDFRILALIKSFKYQILSLRGYVFHSQLSHQGPRKSVDLVHFITLSILYISPYLVLINTETY